MSTNSRGFKGLASQLFRFSLSRSVGFGELGRTGFLRTAGTAGKAREGEAAPGRGLLLIWRTMPMFPLLSERLAWMGCGWGSVEARTSRPPELLGGVGERRRPGVMGDEPVQWEMNGDADRADDGRGELCLSASGRGGRWGGSGRIGLTLLDNADSVVLLSEREGSCADISSASTNPRSQLPCLSAFTDSFIAEANSRFLRSSRKFLLDRRDTQCLSTLLRR
mmetsp:Transcript_50013/g.125642  ORF Transcript_50013/g.125642 Transcript_50013/m.125642 type:complete len:222 (+) Transcript_50013:235-900(+)